MNAASKFSKTTPYVYWKWNF